MECANISTVGISWTLFLCFYGFERGPTNPAGNEALSYLLAQSTTNSDVKLNTQTKCYATSVCKTVKKGTNRYPFEFHSCGHSS